MSVAGRAIELELPLAGEELPEGTELARREGVHRLVADRAYCVEVRLQPELILRRVDGGARFGRLETEVGEGGERVRGGSSARGGRCPAEAGDAELALKLVGDACGELGTDAAGTTDHRFVAL